MEAARGDKSARRMRGDAVVWGYLGNVIRYLLQVLGWVTALQVMHVPVEGLSNVARSAYSAAGPLAAMVRGTTGRVR